MGDSASWFDRVAKELKHLRPSREALERLKQGMGTEEDYAILNKYRIECMRIWKEEIKAHP